MSDGGAVKFGAPGDMLRQGLISLPVPRPPRYATPPLKIAMIAHLKFAIAEPFAGGLEMHTHMLASMLRARGHDVTVFASTASDPSIGAEAICDETSLLNTGVAEATDVAFFREHHAYLRLMNELRHRPFDVIHNNSLHYLPVSMADAIASPMLTTLHTPPFCWLESGVRLSHPDMRYVAVSEATARMWSHVAHVDTVISNGINLDHFPFQPTPEPYLIWYGRIVPEKGLEFAIDAAERARMPLRIAGPISDEAYFARHVAPRLGESVEYLGHLTHKRLAAHIGRASAALCTPLWEEPYGLVVAEALACGTPVAAFARGGIPEILDETCGVLCAADDVAGLAAAALSAIGLSRVACRARAEAVCDAERMVDAYERVYQEMVALRYAGTDGFPPAEAAAALSAA
jgi:glycosyltransferase involved in cell wall biosynthesis